MYNIVELVGRSLLPKIKSNSTIELYDGKTIYIKNTRTNEFDKLTFVKNKDTNQYDIFKENSSEKPGELITIKPNEHKIIVCSGILTVLLVDNTLSIICADEIEIFE